jgi:starvation-inducible DNA-binding protein
MKIESTKNFAKLGYSLLESAEIITTLNKLLSSYSVYYNKLRNFHWNVTGADFFELHEIFGQQYLRAQQEIDTIAERIRLFGHVPHSTMRAQLSNSSITEDAPGLTGLEMVKKLQEDKIVLITLMEDCIYAANDIGDNGTEHLIKNLITKMETDFWKFSAWLKS